jgi:hypothetical protein
VKPPPGKSGSGFGTLPIEMPSIIPTQVSWADGIYFHESGSRITSSLPPQMTSSR